MTKATYPAAAALAAAVFLSACGTEVSTGEITDGQTLNYSVFEATVNQIFDKDIGGRTCSDSGCHLQPVGPGGAFKIYKNAAPGSAEMLANFISAKGFANLTEAASSKLLLEPLEGAQSITGSHTGGDIFTIADTMDSTSDYSTILGWIMNKEPVNP